MRTPVIGNVFQAAARAAAEIPVHRRVIYRMGKTPDYVAGRGGQFSLGAAMDRRAANRRRARQTHPGKRGRA